VHFTEEHHNMNGFADERTNEPIPLCSQMGDEGITDDELTAMALAADPTQPLSDEALPIGIYLAQLPSPLPQWYMPPAIARQHRWWWPVVIGVVAAFLIIDAFGLCSTYGPLVFA
jgi:hypothetical protein